MRTVPDKILVERHFAGWIYHNHRAAAIVEAAQTLAPVHLRSDIAESRDVLDGADQHGANGNNSDGIVGGRAADRHDGALVLAEDVEGAGFVDGLGVAVLDC